MTRKTAPLILFLLALSVMLHAQLPSKPNPPRLVNDYTGTLTAHQVNILENKLVAYNDSTSTQILVLLVDDLQGYSIEQYATEIGHSWGVGQQGKDNGAVILVKPKKGSESGKVTISTGYGIEQYVTDATAKRIIEREMIPAFKENDYYTGIDNAINVMMDLCSGKFTQDEYNDEDGIPGWLTLLFIIAAKAIPAAAHAPSGFRWAEEASVGAASAEAAAVALADSEVEALAAAEPRGVGS